jgi:oxaloacetate decarboxylase alpha subunit
LNVLAGERYKNITKETEGVLKGEYGSTPAPVNAELQARVLEGGEPMTCRPADKLEPEFDRLKEELLGLEKSEGLVFGDFIDDDVLTYALFPQVGLKFLANRNNPDAFEPVPGSEPAAAEQATVSAGSASGQSETYTVEVQGQQYVVKVTPGGDITSTTAVAAAPAKPVSSASSVGITAPLSGNIFEVMVKEGDSVESGDVVLLMEAMKMETEIRASSAGRVSQVMVREGDTVTAGDTLVTLG